jgi:hypothetical protein
MYFGQNAAEACCAENKSMLLENWHISFVVRHPACFENSAGG